MQSRWNLGSINLLHQRTHEDVIDQRGLARTRHPRDRNETPERDVNVYVAKVVLAGALNLEPLLPWLPSNLGQRNGALA